MLQNLLTAIMDWVGQQGILAPVYFILIYSAANFVFLPLLPFTISGGFLFGTLVGTLAVSTATQLSATLAFLIGRYGPRPWLSSKIEKYERLKMIDKHIGEGGWKLVILTRLSALFPFTILNFSYGLSKIKFWDYFFATWLGMLPGTYVFVSLGADAGSWVNLRHNSRTPGEWVLFAVACAASIIAGIYIVRLYRKIYRKPASA